MFVCRSCIRSFEQALKPGRNRIFHGLSWLRDIHNGAPRHQEKQLVQLKGSSRPRVSLANQTIRRAALEKKTKFDKDRVHRFRVALADPLRLAEHTLKLLRADRVDEAYNLVKFHSRNVQAIVSWNHLINYKLGKGDPTQAFKIFNDMKKRGHKPDAHTFTILLRGLAAYTHIHNILPRALTVYHSMFAENSPVKPSIIHTNAILNVCARAEDLDALYGIISRLPQFGPGSADNLTYTIVLNAIRASARSVDLKLVGEDTTEALHKRRKEAVYQGRMIWREVISRWKKGTIVDENEVCAMARLLQFRGEEIDCDDILSLVEQTMALPRQIPRLGDPARPTHITVQDRDRISAGLEDSPNNNKRSESEPKTRIEVPDLSKALIASLHPSVQGAPDYPSPEFDKVEFENSLVVRPRPGRNTLSVLMDVCLRMNAIEAAHKYWDMITSQVEPDLLNFHAYLRILRKSRSSAMVVELLKDLTRPKSAGGIGLEPTRITFRIALSSCARNIMNPLCLTDATSILRMMTTSIDEVDFKAVEIFGKLTEHSKNNFNYEQMLDAAKVLDTVVGLARSQVFYSGFEPDDKLGSRQVASNYKITVKDSNRSKKFRSREEVFDEKSLIHNEQERGLLNTMRILIAQISRIFERYGEQLVRSGDEAWLSGLRRQTGERENRLMKRLGLSNISRSYARRLQQRASSGESLGLAKDHVDLDANF